MDERKRASPQRLRVVIIGAGFAGLYAARALKRAPVDLTVIDRRNHHLFQPLLYQVATATVDPSDIASPIRSLLRNTNTDIQLAEVLAIHPSENTVELADERLPYDFLILATGAKDAYFGHADWPEHVVGLKSLDDALEIRRRVLLAFEEAEREPNPERKKAWMTFVLIGGGPTGVEMAGALAEVSRHTLRKDFHHIDPREARIILLEGTPHLLRSYPPDLRASAKATLEKLGVEVRTGARVTEIHAGEVVVGEERIRAATVLWSAGVSASALGKDLDAALDRQGRVKVSPDLSVPAHPNVFVVGDMAFIENDGKPVPGLAPAAIQMGKHAAKQIVRAVRNQPREPFRYWDRGSFSVIGRGAAVGVAFKSFKMQGLLAWLGWLFIHLFFLIGFKNRIFVLAKWAYSYATMRRGSRLITGTPARRARALGPYQASGSSLGGASDSLPAPPVPMRASGAVSSFEK